MAQRIRFGSFTIDSASRTPITVPATCHRVVLRNADLVNDATMWDAASAGNSKALSAGAEQRFEIEGASVVPYFAGADIVVWVQASSGTGPIIAEYHCVG